MALDIWGFIPELLGPAAQGTRVFARAFKADAKRIELLIARLGYDARERVGNTKVNGGRESARGLVGVRDTLWPGSNDKLYQPEAVGKDYHVHWARFRFWRGLDKVEPGQFRNARMVLDRVTEEGPRSRYCLPGEISLSAPAARAEILVEWYRCLPAGDAPADKRDDIIKWEDVEQALRGLDKEAQETQDPQRQAHLYAVLRYVWERVASSIPKDKARQITNEYKTHCNQCKKEEEKKCDLCEHRHHMHIGDQLEAPPKKGRILADSFHRRLPWVSYLLLAVALVPATIVVLARPSPSTLMAGVRGNSADPHIVGAVLLILGIASLVVSGWLFRLASRTWNKGKAYTGADLSKDNAVSGPVGSTG
jgi:hypothetical protein